MTLEPDSKTPRKAIPKRVRFEVLRRDNYTCRYCRVTDDAPLTIDHVLPVVLGGTDDPSNLVAACKDCNAGKSSSNPDAATVAQVSEDALRWAAAMKLAGERAAASRKARAESLRPFYEIWTEATEGYPAWVMRRYALPEGWQGAVLGLLDSGMPLRELLEAVIVTVSRHPVPENAFRYMLGVANNMLARLCEDARQLVADGAV